MPAPPNTWTIHLQTHDDLLLVIHARDLFADAAFAVDEKVYYTQVGRRDGRDGRRRRRRRNWSAGMAIYDISKPTEPRQIGFFPVEGVGIHRIWYVGGRYAYVSALIDGYSDYIFVIVDLADPTRPVEAGPLVDPRHASAGGEMPVGAKADAMRCIMPG